MPGETWISDMLGNKYFITDSRWDWNDIVPIKLTVEFFIEDVIFNGPATIVKWSDGTKTVVKCQDGDTFDKEKGIALCFMKKALGNKSKFNNTFKKYIDEEKEDKKVEDFKFKVGDRAICINPEAMNHAPIHKGDYVIIASLNEFGHVDTVFKDGTDWYVDEFGLKKV